MADNISTSSTAQVVGKRISKPLLSFVAELPLAAWAFLYGGFNPHAGFVDPSENFGRIDASLPSFNLRTHEYKPPPLSRITFTHASSNEWRDGPGFDSYFLRAIFLSVGVEVSDDWSDLAAATSYKSMGPHPQERAWHFPIVLLSDRSVAFRGEACGSRTQRIAAESWECMVQKGGIDVFGRWWNLVREGVMGFAGVRGAQSEKSAQEPSLSNTHITDSQSLLPLAKQVTITHINRQVVRRHLIPEDHDRLVQALQELVKRKKEKEGFSRLSRQSFFQRRATSSIDIRDYGATPCSSYHAHQASSS
ncbi:hypothetical protein BDZ97DRAFT_1912522 [Flammula alnicola]|nr:hypothetical protein BDZ97DRAFT_1912522 [Flammula alnicola]